jgi:hypothetical protein
MPYSFSRDGFITAKAITDVPRLLVGIDGESDTGKTEFAMSAPGPGLGICLDRGIDGALNNPTPPPTRRDNWQFKMIQAPLPTQAVQREYVQYYTEFYKWYKIALENGDARSVLIDGDSDSWELQRLAEFGKTVQIPPIMYTNVDAARRAMYAKAWDSEKIVIFTNKVKPEYVDDLDQLGNVIMGNDGKPKQKKSGNLVRQGFRDQSYLFHVQLRTLYNPATEEKEQEWGVQVTKFKTNRNLVGITLWGAECNLQTLLEMLYPDKPLQFWGY